MRTGTRMGADHLHFEPLVFGTWRRSPMRWFKVAADAGYDSKDKRNVGPDILNRIVGPVLPLGSGRTKAGMLSAAAHGAPKPP